MYTEGSPPFRKNITAYLALIVCRRFPALQGEYHSLPGNDCVQEIPRPSGTISLFACRLLRTGDYPPFRNNITVYLALIAYRRFPTLQEQYHCLPGVNCIQEDPHLLGVYHSLPGVDCVQFLALQGEYYCLPCVDCVQEVPHPSGRISLFTWG